MPIKDDKKAKFKKGFNGSTERGGGGYFVATWEAAASRTDDPTPAVWFSEDAVTFDQVKKHYSGKLSTETKIIGQVVVLENGTWRLVIAPTSKIKTKSALVQVIRAFAEHYASDSTLSPIVKKAEFKKINESAIKVQRTRTLAPVEVDEIAEPEVIGERDLDGPRLGFDDVEGAGDVDEEEEDYVLPESFTFFLPTRDEVEAGKAGKANTSKSASESSYVMFLETLHGWHHSFKGGVVPWERVNTAVDSLTIIRRAIATWVDNHKVLKKDRRKVLKGIYELVESHLAELKAAKVDAAIGLGIDAFSGDTAAVEMITMEQELVTQLEGGELSKEEALVTQARLESIQRHTAQIKLEESSKVKLDGKPLAEKEEVFAQVEAQTDVVIDLIESEGVNKESRKSLEAAIKAAEAMLKLLANQAYAQKKPHPGSDVPKIPVTAKRFTGQLGKLVDAVRAAGGDREADVILDRFQRMASKLIALEIDSEKDDGDWPTAIMRGEDLASILIRLSASKTESTFVAERVDLPGVMGPIGVMDFEVYLAACGFVDTGTQPKAKLELTFSGKAEAQQVIDGMEQQVIDAATTIIDALLNGLSAIPTRIQVLARAAFDAALEVGPPPDGDQVAAYSAAANVVVLRWLNPQIASIRTVKGRDGKVINSRFVSAVQDLIQKVANDTVPRDKGGDFGRWAPSFISFYETYNPTFHADLIAGIDRTGARLV